MDYNFKKEKNSKSLNMKNRFMKQPRLKIQSQKAVKVKQN